MDKHFSNQRSENKNSGGTDESTCKCEVRSGDVSLVEFLDTYSQAIITVVNAIGPSVVSISAGDHTEKNCNTLTGAASGFTITPDGYILTNSHVVSEMGNIDVLFMDGKRYPATVVGDDPATDLAVMQVDATALPAI